MKKRILSLLAVVMVLGLCSTAGAVSENELSAPVEGSAKYTPDAVKARQFGAIGSQV